MTLPVFSIPYDDSYTSSIEFKTQINEKMKGKEQRYPVWTYPKRTFALKFDKNFRGRKELEDFFISVMGQAGKFRFIWDEEKGGNGQEYICTFESDSLKQNIKDFGFCETELKLVCIDRTPFEDPGEFDFWHDAECENSIDFYTLVDKVFTAQNNKKSWWDAPKKSWTLSFDKTPEIRKKLENFFIAKRGRFRTFNWTWEKDRGGDGKTYPVRFDSDILNSEIAEYGFGTLQVKLKEVFKTENPQQEIEKDEIIPRRLLNVEIEGGSVHILDNETLEFLMYDNVEYIGASLSLGDMTRDDNSSVAKRSVALSNVDLSFSGIIGNRGDVITNAPAVISLVFLDLNTNTLLSDYQRVEWAGKCNNLKLNHEDVSFDIETPLGGYEIQAPVMKYRATCQVRRFKDCRCGYKGEEEKCDRTFTRCKELGNHANFRGFPTMYKEQVIKV